MAAARDSKGRFTKVGATFVWDSRTAEAGINKTRTSVLGLQRTLNHLRGGADGISTAAQNAMRFAAPAAALFKGGAATAIEFEGQMSAVNAVLMADEKTMDSLAVKAKQLGASTKFTAKEAAEGMEQLASAGFTASQIMAGIEGTLSLAAAGALDLGSASEITGNVINGMGLEAKDATHVADVLAKVSADTATDVRGVGVAFKYSAAQARGMGISLEENAYLLGAMAQSGMKGSSGGTALQNMLSKIAKPTEVGAAAFKKWNIEMTEMGADGKKHLRPINDIVSQISSKISGIQDPLKKAALQEQIFGKIGQKAYSALDAQIKAHMKLTDEERAARSVESFMPENVAGAAKKMADLRLVGVAGAFEQLKSASEGFMLEVFSKESLAPMERFIKDITNTVSGVVQVMQSLAAGGDAKELEEKWGSTIVGIAQGVRDAMQAIREAFTYVRAKLAEFSDSWGQTFGGDGTRQITKFIILFAAIATVAAPIIATLLGIGFVISSVLVPAVMGLGSILAAVFSPVTLIIGGIVLAMYMLKGENESLLDVVGRVWGSIKDWMVGVYEGGVRPFVEGLMYAYEVVAPMIQGNFVNVFSQLMDTFGAVVAMFKSFFGESETDWREWGMIIGSVIGGVVMTALNIMKSVLERIEYGANAIRQAFKDFSSGNILSGFARLGTALMDLVLEPFRDILKTAISIADSVSVPVPEAIRGFAFGGIGLAKAKERLGAEDDEIQGKPSSAPNYAYIPEIAKSAAEIEAEKSKAVMAGLPPDMQAAMEGALNSHEGKKKPCETNVTSTLNVDGKQLAKAEAKYKTEMDDRAGYENPPYQRRQMMSHGSSPGR